MAGWNLKSGSIKEYNLSEERIWSLFNYVFSDSCRKRNTYKFGLIKALVDNAFNGEATSEGIYYSYEQLFGRFAENYWNLVAKYDIRQMRKDGRSELSKIERIIKSSIENNIVLESLEFESIDEVEKRAIIKEVVRECKKCVVGALYEDFEGVIYSFDLKDDGLVLNPAIHDFFLKYKSEIERLNYYSWAKFLEQVNSDDALIRVIDKLELSTPRRRDLFVYREILYKEFEEKTCFYCGRKLNRKMHVDHFVPWSFVKDDKIWNFVLSCSSCNESKKNRVPSVDYVYKIEDRNKKLITLTDDIIQIDFETYSKERFEKICKYAKLAGLKEYCG